MKDTVFRLVYSFFIGLLDDQPMTLPVTLSNR